VLPFVNQNAATQYVSDGMTEILIDTLARLPRLRVMAPATVFRFKGTHVDPKQIAKELSVEALVTGQIRRQDERYAIRAELIDAADGAQLWSARFDVPVSELASIQNRIADELSTRLRGGEHGASTGRRATSAEVYELYTKGLYAWNRRGKEDLKNAVADFDRAVALDPQFAPAYAGLANVYGVMIGYGWITVPEGTAKVVANAQKALDLDPNNAEALVSLATTRFRNLWDFAAAGADYRRALALNPNYATGHQWYADYLRVMGRWEEARREIDLASRLDPFSMPIKTGMCFGYYSERRYREAIAFASRNENRDAGFGIPFCIQTTLIEMGDLDGAIALMKKTKTLPWLCLPEMDSASRRDGSRGFFSQWIKCILADSRANAGEPAVLIAELYSRLGDRDRAFAWLERGYAMRISTIAVINIDPALDPLHDDPRWDDLLRRIGLPKVQPPNFPSSPGEPGPRPVRNFGDSSIAGISRRSVGNRTAPHHQSCKWKRRSYRERREEIALVGASGLEPLTPTV
jgi:adenylate cyclase